MADESVVAPKRVFVVGSEKWDLIDETPAAVYVDFLTEARHINGIVHLAFASSSHDANNAPQVKVAARLRMNLVSAQFLHKMLGDMISDALKPVDKSTAN